MLISFCIKTKSCNGKIQKRIICNAWSHSYRTIFHYCSWGTERNRKGFGKVQQLFYYGFKNGEKEDGMGTTHLSVVTPNMAVVVTSSINDFFGSGFLSPSPLLRNSVTVANSLETMLKKLINIGKKWWHR